jgi:two-component system, NarL family, invasion response regulator UvrY
MPQPEDPFTAGGDTPSVAISTLIVDDQEDIRLLLRVLINAEPGLELMGEAATGEEALARVDELHPEVIVLDQMMPGMTGVEVARELGRRGGRPWCVLCSAHLDDRVRSEAEEAGIDRCISKFDVVDIARIIQELAANGPPAA